MPITFGSKKLYYDWASLLEAYRSYARPGCTVLEVGASNVARTRDLAECCDRLVGLELFPERVPEAGVNIEYVVGDWQELSVVVEPESCDIVVASHVIEHVPDDLAAINELYTVLRSGGVGLLNTPNRKRLVRALIESVRGERQFPWWEHLREYAEEDLTDLIERSRFTDYAIRPVALGLHGGRVFAYLKKTPESLRKYACFWEVHLFKD
jgi:SAM-dependent methyltransferase